MRAERTINKPAKRSFALGYLAIGFIVFMICICFIRLSQEKSAQLKERKAVLAKIENQIEKEKAESAYLDDQAIYRKSEEYIEQQARDNFGLVYPNEIVLEEKK
jgi:cell division protein FtsB